MRPAMTTRRQPAILIVLAALWSAHGVPAGAAWHSVARNAQSGWTSTVSNSARAKVLLGRLSLERRHSRARTNLPPLLEQLLFTSGVVWPRLASNPSWTAIPPAAQVRAAYRHALFGRPPPVSFPA
ncbi:MAG: hypothetical protein ACRD4P_13050 [Bryobacteraceae bacterium]